MRSNPTLMAAETLEVPAAVERLLTEQGGAIRALGQRLSARQPRVVVTAARGSSDHAAGYLKYLMEIMAGVPVASIGPSVASIYGGTLRLDGAVQVAISQSGRSPDLLALQAAAKSGGALTIALVNDTASPLATEADVVVPLCAGPERSVAATKSFVCSAAAVAALVAAWTGDRALQTAVDRLPETLASALDCDWGAARQQLQAIDSLYVLGRGPALPFAQEAALKCKEAAALQAEAFSSAEVMHGPFRLVQKHFTVLALVPDDAAREANKATLGRIVDAGGNLLTVSARADGLLGQRLSSVATGHGFVDPIAAITTLYRAIEQVTRSRGHDPDRPVNLRKVTETV